jgi:hypothetical protein
VIDVAAGQFPASEPDREEYARLMAYVGSDEFRRRVAAVRAREQAGEDLTLRDIARALRVPRWFVDASLAHFRARLARQQPCFGIGGVAPK